MDQKIIKDINYVRECSKAVKGLSKGLNKFEENIYCADDGEYIFKLSSEKDKGDIEQIIRTATKPFNSGEDLNRIKKNLKKYFNKTDSKNFLKTWNEFVGQLVCIRRYLSIPGCVEIKSKSS